MTFRRSLVCDLGQIKQTGEKHVYLLCSSCCLSDAKMRIKCRICKMISLICSREMPKPCRHFPIGGLMNALCMQWYRGAECPKTEAFVLSVSAFALSLHKIGYVRQFDSKLSLRSLALSLHKTSYTREIESELSFLSFALFLHKIGCARQFDSKVYKSPYAPYY